MFADEILPVFDTSDELAVVVDAPVPTVWDALLDADLIDVGRRKPMVALLGALRVLPELVLHVLHGETPAAAPEHARLRDLPALAGAGNWVLLGERPQSEIALGLVGKFWLPVIAYADVPAERFRSFDEPGYAKTIYAFSLRSLAPTRTLLVGVMRTSTTDESARRWFRRYWTFGVGSGAHILVQSLLDVVRDDAEQRAGSRAPAS